MTLRGGGKGNPKTAAPRTSTVPGMSAAHRSALDRLVALDTKEKKKADKRKLTKLIYKILRKEGVKMNKTYLSMCQCAWARESRGGCGSGEEGRGGMAERGGIN